MRRSETVNVLTSNDPTLDRYNPSDKDRRKWTLKEPTDYLRRAWRFASRVMSREDYNDVYNYVSGGEPVDIMIMFNLGVNVKNYSNELRKAISSIALIVSAVDSFDMGYESRAFHYLDTAKDIIKSLEKKSKESRIS